MKIYRILISCFLLSASTTQTHSMCFFGSKEAKRQAYNQAELDAFKSTLAENPKANVAVASDLHDVLFERQAGDLTRARQLSLLEWVVFFRHLIPFGAQYLAAKVGLMFRPCLEQGLASYIQQPQHEPLLKLITPFKLNEQTYTLYRTFKSPIYACSNSGPNQFDFVDQQSNSRCSQLFKGLQISTPENNYLQKDRPETYEALHDTITQTRGKPDIIVMIDDKQKNLALCKKALEKRNCKVYGFVFKNTKDFEKSLKDQDITL